LEPPSRRPRAQRLWDLGLSELTPECQHDETVSNPDVGTSEQKAQIRMGMGTWQECHRTSGHTSEKVGSPAVRAGRQRALITEERRLPASSNCYQKADVANAGCASQAGVTSEQRANHTKV